MKVLLVCSGGMSTSILMKKLQKYAVENGRELEIAAVAMSVYPEVCRDYDCILLGPQVMYHLDAVRKRSGMPCDVIAPQDYGIGNCANIFKQIDGLLK